jgi:hypothetical protein
VGPDKRLDCLTEEFLKKSSAYDSKEKKKEVGSPSKKFLLMKSRQTVVRRQ